jgi:hypothetical protein
MNALRPSPTTCPQHERPTQAAHLAIVARERWARGDLELVQQTAERVLRCAKSIIETAALDVDIAA